MLVIGITGGVGAGKSSVLQILRQQCSCKIVLADEVGNKVKEPGQKCYQQIVELLGEDILQENAAIDKNKMAAKIFADRQLLEKVNAVIHPAVKEYVLRDISEEKEKQHVKVYFLEAALLIEAGYLSYLDELWYIFAKKDVRINRLKETRGYSDEKIRQIMESQLSEEEFRRFASVVLDNSGTWEETFVQVQQECQKRGLWKEEKK